MLSTLMRILQLSTSNWILEKFLKIMYCFQGWGYKFDLTNGYHHVEINFAYRMFLGFSWGIKGKTCFFLFHFLPFGLSSGPYILTKILTPLPKYWRGLGVKIYLDDGGQYKFGRKTFQHCQMYVGTDGVSN